MNHRLFNALGVALALLVGAGNARSQHGTPGASQPQALDKASFRSAMRMLWEDHITWTRLYIVSALAELPDKEATTHRLLQNQSDIGNAIKSFYGDAAGEKLSMLLKDHILIAADLIAAAKSGDNLGRSRASARWSTNADEIAGFLSGANPDHWAPSEMKAMMHEHLSSTTAEVVARLNSDWEGDVRAYDSVHAQILEMADMLSDGIVGQFPRRFK